MKELKRLSLVVVTLLLSIMMAFSQEPNIHILTTGRTTVGTDDSTTFTNYTVGQVTIGTLLDAVSELKNIANVTGEQVVHIDSQNMNDGVWLILAKKINQLLKHPDIDGTIITHGTDIMEETAYSLNLTVKSDKLVTLVGAVRPSTALSTDGPLNLYNAVVTAGAKGSVGRGALVAMNGLTLGVENVLKINTIDIQTFQAPNSGTLGYIFNGRVFYNQAPPKKHTIRSVFDATNLNSLPKVGIVYSYPNIEADIVTPLLHHDYEGIIHVGIGNGNIHKNIFPVLTEARKKETLVVRSSRVSTEPTTLDAGVNDVQYQFIAPQELNPQKSRVLLMFVLTKTNSWEQIQQYLNEYQPGVGPMRPRHLQRS